MLAMRYRPQPSTECACKARDDAYDVTASAPPSLRNYELGSGSGWSGARWLPIAAKMSW